MGKRKPTSAARKNTSKGNYQNRNKVIQISAPRPTIGQVRDANSRTIFKNANLCAQFIKDNIDIPELKDVKPEDITDMTEKYQAYLGIQFESDTVKRIQLHNASGEAERKPFDIRRYSRLCIMKVRKTGPQTCIWQTEFI